MTGETSYRLVEYKITENLSGYLWWERHFGLGSFKRGQCFIRGNILFIEFSDIAEDGFLKMEFIEQLNRLPKWRKTKYYCLNYKIYNCKTGNNPSLQEMTAPSHLSRMNRKPCRDRITDCISYRLGKYEIIEESNGQIRWNSHKRFNMSKTGNCSTAREILFIWPAESEKAGLSKNEFAQHLSLFPNWTKTAYYCDVYSLYYCENGRIVHDIEEIHAKTDSDDKKIKSSHERSKNTVDKSARFNQTDMIKISDPFEKGGGSLWTLFKSWYAKRSVK